jgi:DNA-binding ferritin-like protein
MMIGQFQLSEEERTYISEIIYAVLASEYFLQLRTLNYHWNYIPSLMDNIIG